MPEQLQTLTELLEHLVSSPYVTAATILLSVVSLISAIIYRRRSNKYKELSAVAVTTGIVTDRRSALPDLQVLYAGNALDTVSVTTVRIRNRGSDVVKANDIAPADPVVITITEPPEGVLLEHSILHSSSKAANFTLARISDKAVRVCFDFLEPRAEATIRILHTGRDTAAVALSGTLIGARRPLKLTDIAAPGASAVASTIFRAMFKYPVVFAAVVFLTGAAVLAWMALSLPTTAAVRAICSIPSLLLVWFVVRIALRGRRSETTYLLEEMAQAVGDSLAAQVRTKKDTGA
jgi:hypothetical protein